MSDISELSDEELKVRLREIREQRRSASSTQRRKVIRGEGKPARKVKKPKFTREELFAQKGIKVMDV